MGLGFKGVVNFHGVSLYKPQAAVNTDETNLRGRELTGTGVIGIVGIAGQGKSNSPLVFTSPAEAARTLVSGELLECIKRAFNEGAWKIVGVRVGGGTGGTAASQATATVVDGSSANTMTFTSTIYGVPANGILYKIETGGSQGKKLSFKYDGDTIYRDNLYRSALSIYYAGGGTSPTVTISATSGAGSTPGVALSATSDSAAVISPSFAQYPTLQKMVDFINSQGKWVAVITHPNPDVDSTVLDYLATATVSTSSGAPTVLESTAQEIINWINSGAQGWVTADWSSTSSHKQPTNVSSFTGLAGAVDGGTTTTDWSNALDVLLTQDVQLVGAVSGSATVHALVKAHVELASTAQYASERTAILGGIAAESVTTAKARVAAIASKRVSLVWPGIKDVSATGVQNTVLAPYYTAASLLGAEAGVSTVAQGITRKVISAQGLEIDPPPTKGDIDTALQGGLLPLELVPGVGVRVVHGRTTWTADNNYAAVERSVRRCADYVGASVRNDLDSLVGSIGGPTLRATILARTKAVLKRLEAESVIVGDDVQPAWRNISIEIDGDVVTVSFEASPAIPANFILIEAHLTTFKSP